jgi:hypothetical protein
MAFCMATPKRLLHLVQLVLQVLIQACLATTSADIYMPLVSIIYANPGHQAGFLLRIILSNG